MDNFKQASRIGLRVQTAQGVLSVEQLWSLSLNKLSIIVKNVKKQLNGSEGDSDLTFLDETKVVDKELQLTFDILKDIYLTKKGEMDAEKDKLAKKVHNEKIMTLIAEKQDKALGEKSVDELMAMLQE
jgi:hypothetical protein